MPGKLAAGLIPLIDELRAGCTRLAILDAQHQQQLAQAELCLDAATTEAEYFAAWQAINDLLTEQGQALDRAADWAADHNERTTGLYYRATAS